MENAIKERKLLICEKCGTIAIFPSNSCSCQSNQLKQLDLTVSQKQKMTKKEIDDYLCGVYGEDKFNLLNDYWNENKTGQNVAPIYCPKCKSTQIQAVARKWSLLTGFFTNKVDRVCLNCKHKF